MVHERKAWRGLREFLREYLIVVVGVLTALAAQGAVEAVRNRTDAAEATDAISGEIVSDITRVEQRDFAHPCVQKRLDELTAVVDAAGPDGRIRGPSWIGRPPRYAVETARWEAASQSGRVSLLPAERQSRLGFIYTTLRYYYELNNAEQQTWSRLDGMTGLDRLGPEGKLAMKGEIEQARFFDSSMHQVAGLILDRAAAQGLKPMDRHDPPWVICLPNTTSAAEVEAAMFSRNRDHPQR